MQTQQPSNNFSTQKQTMFHLAPIIFNNENISGLTGSISISCWVIVFVPQIYENFYRESSDGLSLLFIILWLAGDVFNLFGAMMQHLLLTMIILAAYYTVADIILLGQCLYYTNDNVDETKNLDNIDPLHFNPVNPMNVNVLHDVFQEHEPLLVSTASTHQAIVQEENENIIELQESLDKGNYIQDLCIVSSVIFAGFICWYIPYCNRYYSNETITSASLSSSSSFISKFSPRSIIHITKHDDNVDIEMNWVAQLFGYLSAALYLGSRVPQILLNFQRKSCEGISFLFFLFACLGNITFITSVLAISRDYQYLLLNASWLMGSSGTLIMDFIIFLQFFAYGKGKIVLDTEATI